MPRRFVLSQLPFKSDRRCKKPIFGTTMVVCILNLVPGVEVIGNGVEYGQDPPYCSQFRRSKKEHTPCHR